MNSQSNAKSSTPEKCIKCAKSVPFVCFFSNFTLAVFKISVGWLTGSKGLFADGVHSFSDVIATSGVIVSLKISDKGEDEKYPYGRGKIEFISCIFVYSVLFIVALLILATGIKHIIVGDLKTPHILALFSAIVSVIANIMLYRMGICAGRAINSPAIVANANENKADLLSSIAVIIGIIGCHLGYRYSDAIAAILVGLIILKTATTLGWKSIEALIDTSIPEEKLKLINEIILNFIDVKKVNYIKTRQIGKHYWIDVEIQLSPELTVREGDIISQAVKSKLMNISDRVKDVIVIASCERPKVKTNKRLLRKLITKFALSW